MHTNVNPQDILNLCHSQWAKGFLTGALLGMGSIFVVNSGRVKINWKFAKEQKT